MKTTKELTTKEERGRMQEEVDKAYDIGYEKGARAVIDAVSNWLDEDTVSELRERFLGEK
jgi:hypothetical protein